MLAFEHTALGKLSQVAKGSKRCEGCGLNKDLGEFIQKWGEAIRKSNRCENCRKETRIAAGKKKSLNATLMKQAPKVPAKLSRDQRRELQHIAIRLDMLSLCSLDPEAAKIAKDIRTVLEGS